MTDFNSLTLALETWFDKPLSKLPKKLRLRVEKEFFPMPWNDFNAYQRRSVSLQLDYQHDPATASEQQFWWNFFERESALKTQVAQWEAATTRTASELALRETRLKELRKELALMKQQQRQARGDYYPVRKQPDGAMPNAPVQYLAYPKAMKLLVDRLDATPEELAAWVWMGPQEDGLAAYLNANELDPPPRFYYFTGTADDFDYLSPLMACWFKEEDITAFAPDDRYITGKTLIERWGKQPGIKPEAFIRAKIAESRLLDIHPIYGGTQGTFSQEAIWPSLAEGLFLLAHVEAIEASDFEVDEKTDESATCSCQPVLAGLIRQRFPVIRNEDANDMWWKGKMADAKRYGLLECRVGDGKKGRGVGSLWRPDMIAGWLVDRHTNGKEGLPVDAVYRALKQFPGCGDIAEQMFPQDE